MALDASSVGVVAATTLASGVEFVEALTIVLAMGVTRGWRSALWGAGLAALVLAALTAVLGSAVGSVVAEATLQLVVGALLLVVGLQWLRKALLRAAGLKALHDEEAIYARERQAAREAGARERFGLDAYGFVVAFKGVLLEGLEVVFIVLTFGRNAGDVGLAAAGAGIAAAVVIVVGVLAHRPLARVPENTMKLAVGLLLSTFGTFWVAEGVGTFSAGGESFAWPGGDAALLGLLAAWSLGSWLTVRRLRGLGRPAPATA